MRRTCDLADTPSVLTQKGIFDGMGMWEIQYGYEKHTRHMACIRIDTKKPWMAVSLEASGLPIKQTFKHYQMLVHLHTV